MNANRKNIFDWGETVMVKRSAPPYLEPGQVGSICGMDKITVDTEAQEFLCNIGDWVYTVEYVGGLDNEIAECYLKRYPHTLKYITKEKIITKTQNTNNYHNSEIATVVDFHLISAVLKKCLERTC
ncbi:MAG: hypothetical protein KDK76_02020 [Chlamydiia bacterium]|nr:hypothetical protein [Chlamydiia bacterium]